MKIVLLTHQRELSKASNTGQLVMECLGGMGGGVMVERVTWDRVNPNLGLVEGVESNAIALLFPKEESEQGREAGNAADFENFIILDGTWQEARKIYNKSPYLKAASKVSLGNCATSQYSKRRNQIVGGLCTAEAVIALLKVKGKSQLADNVQQAFDRFNGSSL
ncbi:MAG: DTW domain-containing protein [Moraxellaceae bacterium]|nr:MAG: DTW domain-containing protein [Moraxellaceae bacterium]